MQASTKQGLTASHRLPSEQSAPCRVLLRGWGMSEEELSELFPALPTLNGKLEWAVHDGDAPWGALVIHVVSTTLLSEGSASGFRNGTGPVEAMRAARMRGTSEIAIVTGSAQHLPLNRTGCWILAGQRSLAAAIEIVVRSAIEPLFAANARQPHGFHELAIMNAIGILARTWGETGNALSQQVLSILRETVIHSHVLPTRLLISGHSDVVDDLGPMSAYLRRTVRTFGWDSPRHDFTADMVIAYPWPSDGGMTA